MGVNGADDEVLRALVREVLAELLPAGVEAGGALSVDAPGALTAGDHVVGRPGLGQPGLAHSVREDVEAVETVSLRTDADLDAFVRRLLRLFENPKQRDALRAGRLRFRLPRRRARGRCSPPTGWTRER